MIASLAQFERGGGLSSLPRRPSSLTTYLTDLCKPLEPNICRLAKKGKYPVCSAAVKALVALGAPRELRIY